MLYDKFYFPRIFICAYIDINITIVTNDVCCGHWNIEIALCSILALIAVYYGK